MVQHHVEPHAADARHVVEHDAIAALGHDRQFGAGLVGPHAQPQEPGVGLLAHGLDLGKVASGLGAGLVQVFERCARQFELACRLEAHGAIGAAHRDDVGAAGRGAFLDRFPAEFGQGHQQIVDAAGLVIAGGVVIVAAEHELFMLRADPPIGLGLFAFAHRLCELRDRGDHGIILPGGGTCAHDAP
jgi:hypothetical protein